MPEPRPARMIPRWRTVCAPPPKRWKIPSCRPREERAHPGSDGQAEKAAQKRTTASPEKIRATASRPHRAETAGATARAKATRLGSGGGKSGPAPGRIGRQQPGLRQGRQRQEIGQERTADKVRRKTKRTTRTTASRRTSNYRTNSPKLRRRSRRPTRKIPAPTTSPATTRTGAAQQARRQIQSEERRPAQSQPARQNPEAGRQRRSQCSQRRRQPKTTKTWARTWAIRIWARCRRRPTISASSSRARRDRRVDISDARYVMFRLPGATTSAGGGKTVIDTERPKATTAYTNAPLAPTSDDAPPDERQLVPPRYRELIH